MAESNTPDERQLARIQDALGGSPLCHLVNVFKAGLATVPWCGGIASLMTDYIPSERMRRLEQLAEDAAQDLRRLQDKVRTNELHTQEYAYLFEQCFRGAATHYQQEKLRAFRAILVNAATKEEPPQAEREFFLGLVDRLSVLHLQTLNLLSCGERTGLLTDAMRTKVPEASHEIIAEVLVDCVRLRLVLTRTVYVGEGPDPNKMRFDNTELTLLGSRFVDFCTVPSDESRVREGGKGQA